MLKLRFGFGPSLRHKLRLEFARRLELGLGLQTIRHGVALTVRHGVAHAVASGAVAVTIGLVAGAITWIRVRVTFSGRARG